jgi:hypothetical protein
VTDRVQKVCKQYGKSYGVKKIPGYDDYIAENYQEEKRIGGFPQNFEL